LKEDRLYLIHIQEAIARIEEYTREGEDVFLEDHKTQDAVLRNLHTLAESAQRISNDLKSRHPQVDWRILSAFRNVVVHDYLGISLDRIWDTIVNDLPVLKKNISSILVSLE
jgi:uncharacterized protein with HEPN domain